MIKNEINFILPSKNDGGGNRWSYALASMLIKKNKKIKINFYYPEFKNLSNIYKLNKLVNIKVFKSKFKSKFLVYIFFIFFLKKTISKKSTIIISDPVLSIFMFLFNKNLVIRNVASDDYNLYNFSHYRYFGILPIYKLLTYISFFYKNVYFVFNSSFTFSKIFLRSKLPFQINNINSKIIHPMIDNIYLKNNKNIYNKRENSIVIFPRKHNNKGFDLIHKIKNLGLMKKLNISKIYLIFNKNETFKYLYDNDYTIINPKSDQDIINILDKSYCFISTSSSEGFGLPPLEAMSRGCVPIIIDAGGTSSYCFNGYNSLVCKKNDATSLSNNMLKLFRDQKLHYKLSSNGFDTSTNFNQEHISNLWYEFIFSKKVKEIKTKKTLINFLYLKLNNYFLIYKGCDLKIRFNILIEIFFLPFFYIYNYIYLIDIKISKYSEIKLRSKNTNTVNICLQDWSEYTNIRYKKLKNGFIYKCGLNNQIHKLYSEKYNTNKYLYLTFDKYSDVKNKTKNFKNINFFIKNNFKIVYTDNDYLDFSSYSDFYNKIYKKNNDILLFMNSSVSTDFNEPIIDNYVDYFNKNLDIGLLGISANTKKYQSIILNNFNPHIQSLFFITTSNVLKEVIKMNNNIFPGLDSTKKNKYSLILNGEIKLSKIVMKLGYKIAVINEYGKVNKFTSKGFLKNRSSWPININDMRLNSNYPSQTKLIL